MHVWYRLSPTEAPKRSPKWKAARKKHLQEHPECAGCGTKIFLQVHHKKTFHDHPELELDPANFITLCERPIRRHHFLLGHKGNWKDVNENVDQDAALERTLYPEAPSVLGWLRWK